MMSESRRFFLRSMLGAAALLSGPRLHALDPLKVCFLSGYTEVYYNSDINLKLFQDTLEKSHGVQGSWIQGKMAATAPLTGLSALPGADALVMCVRRMTLPAAQVDTLRKFIEAGGGVVALRASSHGFENWVEFDREVLGADYSNFWEKSPTQTAINASASSHPVLAGVAAFPSASFIYSFTGLAPDVTVLMQGTQVGVAAPHTQPVVWVRQLSGGARIFYSTLEHEKDWADPNFMRMMINAVNWVSGRTDAGTWVGGGGTVQPGMAIRVQRKQGGAEIHYRLPSAAWGQPGAPFLLSIHSLGGACLHRSALPSPQGVFYWGGEQRVVPGTYVVNIGAGSNSAAASTFVIP